MRRLAVVLGVVVIMAWAANCAFAFASPSSVGTVDNVAIGADTDTVAAAMRGPPTPIVETAVQPGQGDIIKTMYGHLVAQNDNEVALGLQVVREGIGTLDIVHTA